MVTVACVVATHNLAIGVVIGSITAMVIFAKRVAHLAEVTAIMDPDNSTVVYRVTGELFSASSNDLVGRFDYVTGPRHGRHRPVRGRVYAWGCRHGRLTGRRDRPPCEWGVRGGAVRSPVGG